MLRALILLLVLANGCLLAANLGVLERFIGPGKDREPERLLREVNPAGLRLAPGTGSADSTGAGGAGTVAAPGLSASAALPTSAALPASAGASAAASPAGALPPVLATQDAAASGAGAGACLQAGPVVGDQLTRLERDLRAAGLPEGSWRSGPWPGGGGFMIVMGRYPDQATLERKQNELRRRKVAWTELQAAPNLPPGLIPGLNLGRFDTEDAALAGLSRLEPRGVRTARVEALLDLPGQQLVRLPNVDASLQARLAKVAPPANTSWAPCPTAEAKKG